MNVRTYDHDGVAVAVQTHLKDRQDEHCLCSGCARFQPDSPRNCHIAEALRQTCSDFSILAPVWACPQFVPR